MKKQIDILHINHNSRGTEGLYEDGIIRVLEEKGYIQNAFVSSEYPFEYGYHLFFKLANSIKISKSSLFIKAIKFFELCFDFIYIYIYIQRRRPKVVNHSLLSRFMLPERLFIKAVCKVPNVKVVITCHDVIPFYNKEIAIRQRREIMSKADFLLIHSNSSRQELIDFFHVTPEKIISHPFPLMDLSRLYPLHNVDKDIDYLFTGYIRKSKGIHVLLEAWKQFVDRGDKKLVVAGALSDEDINLSCYEGIGIDFKLYFLSPTEYCDLLNRSKCVILPYIEGTNSAILYSAIAAGCDVIASNIPMFVSDELVPRDHLFISGDSDDLCRVLRDTPINDDRVNANQRKYADHFAECVEAAYKSFLS